jgi:DNA/RNA endonuclease YhcR with UshA esterase domain
MLKLGYEEILKKVIEKTGLPKEEIEEKVSKKIAQLSDLVSKEGAAHIVANQLGVKLFENLGDRLLKIKSIPSGTSFINVLGKVIDIQGINTFTRKDQERRVANLTIADETGPIRVVIWEEELIRLLDNNKFKEGDLIKIKNGYSKENNGRLELHLGSRSEIIANPEGEEIKEVISGFSNTLVRERKKISEVSVGNSAEFFGTIVQVFEPHFYESCPKCSKKPKFDGKTFTCSEHGVVEARKAPILNFFFDDGSGNLRSVCFSSQIEQLLNKKELNEENFPNFEELKKVLLGKQIIIYGRIVENQMFGRPEFMVRDIKEADPAELLDQIK